MATEILFDLDGTAWPRPTPPSPSMAELCDLLACPPGAGVDATR